MSGVVAGCLPFDSVLGLLSGVRSFATRDPDKGDNSVVRDVKDELPELIPRELFLVNTSSTHPDCVKTPGVTET